MTIDQTANFVRGEVSASVASGDTTISVVDASIFPDPSNGNYNLVIWDAENFVRPDTDPDTEVVRVTGRDTTNDNLTVTRGQENTTAVSHPSSSELHLSATAKVFTDIDTKIDSELTITGSNGLNGGSAELGGSIDVSISGGLTLDGDLTAQDGETIWDESATYIPTARLENDSMTIAGNSVSLGGSTAINHSNISNINSDDHHQKYTDENAQDAVGTIVNGGTDITTSYDDANNQININHADSSTQGNVTTGGATVIDDIHLDGRGHVTNLNTQNRSLDDWGTANSSLNIGNNYLDNVDRVVQGSADAQMRFDTSNNRIEFEQDDGGSRIDILANRIYVGQSGTWFGGDHNDLNGVGSSDHHTRYSDSEARSAIEAGNVSEVAFANIESLNSDRSIGIDDSEGPMYRDHSGNHYSLWNSNYVSGGTDISISGGVGASGGDVTISHGDTSTQGNVTTGGATVIDDIYIDGRGHVTNMNTQNRGLDDWATPTSTVQFDRNGIQSVDSWIEIDGDGSGILMNYKNQGDETRFYGPTNVRNTLTIQGSNGGRIVLPVGTDMYA